MLSKQEKKYIKKSLINKLKILRYMAYTMIAICFFLVEIPIFFNHLKNGNIIDAIISILGIIYPAIFFLGFYILIEFISGNQIFKFIRGKYTVSKEIIYT
ncbi:MAG: hypothetical protein K2H53_03565, partial [Clostridia bacterium]|nr:hypothetical protein [Clostridia bacterium]